MKIMNLQTYSYIRAHIPWAVFIKNIQGKKGTSGFMGAFYFTLIVETCTTKTKNEPCTVGLLTVLPAVNPAIITNKWSKNFNERTHHHLVTPRGSEWIRLTWNPHLIHGSFLRPTCQPPKRHLDWFSHVCIHRGKVSQCSSVMLSAFKIAPFSYGIRTPF